MCGRLFVEEDVTQMTGRFHLPFVDVDSWIATPKKDDTSPGINIPVVYKDRIQPTLWGWWFWQKNKDGKDVKRLVINTKAETLQDLKLVIAAIKAL